MAFDGITVSALVAEIDDNLKGGRINKIAQPEKRIPSSDLFYR